MLFKPSIKSNKGISKIAIIITVIIVVVAIIACIIFLLVSQKNKSNVATEPQEEIVWDTNNEITTAEKNLLKEKYLGVFSLLVSNKYQTEEENLAEVACQIIKMRESNLLDANKTSSDSLLTTTSVDSLNQTDDTNITVTPTNSSSSNSAASANLSTGVTTALNQQQTVVNDTVVVTGENPALQGQVSTSNQTLNATVSSNSNTTSETNTVSTSSSSNTAVSNSISTDNSIDDTTTAVTTLNQKKPDANDVATAINEINGSSVGDLDTILASNTKTIIPGYVTDIVSINKVDGVYSIEYKVCWPKNEELTSYGTINKINTGIIDTLESTTVQIQLVRNRNPEYSEYKIKSIQAISTDTPVAYHLSFTNGKYGVIDATGKVIVDNLYDWITIPNSYKDVFICQTGTTTTVLNKEGIADSRFADYSNISAIISASGDNWWYEKDFLVYEQNGKFGAIDNDGFEIFKPLYDKIEPLYYLAGELIITQNGRLALGDITGDVKNFKYSKVGVLGGQFDINSFVNSQRTAEKVQQMMQTGMYILGQDLDGIVEQIKVVSGDEYATNMASVQKPSEPASIADWQLQNVQGFSIYVK